MYWNKNAFYFRKMALLVGIFFLFCSVAGAEPARKKVAVLDFTTGNIDEYGSAAMYATGVMMSELSRSANFTLLERSQLNQILAEQGLSKTGAVAQDSLVQTGQLLGADYLIVGAVDGKAVESGSISFFASIGKEKTMIKVTARMIDARTGEIVFADEVSGEKRSGSSFSLDLGSLQETSFLTADFTTDSIMDSSVNALKFSRQIDNAVADAVRDGVQQLVAHMQKAQPLYGAVVKIDGSKIYINVGKNHGVQKGDVLYIITGEEIIREPGSGKILEVIEQTGGKLKVKEVLDNVAVCTGDKNTRIGMRIKRGGR